MRAPLRRRLGPGAIALSLLAGAGAAPAAPASAATLRVQSGYWLVAGDGGIFPFGGAYGYGSTGGMPLNQPIVGMAATADAGGYWLVASDGGIFPFGDAGGYGSTGGIHLNRPIVGMAATPDGRGYWLVASDGGIFPFGDAVGEGSTGGIQLNQPIVGMAATTDGRGYWLVARDGGVFPFGDARGYGSTGGIHLNQPIVGMAATPDGGGYWLVAGDGGIFPFGDARGQGSTGGIHLNQPIVGMAATPDGGGYWLLARDGGIFPFGDAAGMGSTGGTHLNQPVVGMAPALVDPLRPPRPPVPRSPLPQVSTLGDMALDNGQIGAAGSTSHDEYVFLQEYMKDQIPLIRARNPGTRILMYENVGATNTQCQYDADRSSGVSYCDAAANHPDWFLTDTLGRRLVFTDYAHLVAMDVGNPGYQQAWGDWVIATAKAGGFDGVEMDDVNASPGHGLDGRLARYGDSAYGAAAVRFMQAVAPRLRAAGLLAVPNVGVNIWDATQVGYAQQMARVSSVYNREFNVRWSSGSGLWTGSDWSGNLAFMEGIEALGVPYVGETYGGASDTAAMQYQRATFLLGWDGRPGSASVWRPDGDVDTHDALALTEVGTPAGARHAVGAGWQRDYSGGTVLANPSTAQVSFDLGRSLRRPDGVWVSSVTLAPATGMVLSAG